MQIQTEGWIGLKWQNTLIHHKRDRNLIECCHCLSQFWILVTHFNHKSCYLITEERVPCLKVSVSKDLTSPKFCTIKTDILTQTGWNNLLVRSKPFCYLVVWCLNVVPNSLSLYSNTLDRIPPLYNRFWSIFLLEKSKKGSFKSF